MPLNPQAKLNPRLFEPDVEQKPTRDGYGEGLLAAGENDPNVVALSADLTESTRTEAFARKFPSRFFQVGVAEQNMATIASGLGISGKVAFIASYAAFSPGRNWEQIRTTIAYNDSNVKIAGHHAGISVGADGATHQAVEDIATMRAMANMRVFVPCDALEARKATEAAAHIWGPIYLRFAREKSPIITTSESPYAPGRAELFWEPASGLRLRVLLAACGGLMYQTLLAARRLESEKIGVAVLNCHSVKPLDKTGILAWARKAGAAVAVEEHQIQGGLGGALAELFAAELPLPLEFVGLRDVFGESGPPAELYRKYGMDEEAVYRAAKKVIRRVKAG